MVRDAADHASDIAIHERLTKLETTVGWLTKFLTQLLLLTVAAMMSLSTAIGYYVLMPHGADRPAVHVPQPGEFPDPPETRGRQ